MTDHSQAEVLVVDDETALAESYAAMIGTKHDVRTATSGTEALEVIDAEVDVVLLDRRMPGMPGLAVLAEIHDRGIDPQIILCSAVDPGLDVLDHEFDDYLRKPVGSDKLLATIDRQHRLSDCDAEAREYFALESKRAAVEDARAVSELENDERYESLLAELERRSETVHATSENPISAD
jgi:two-component system response regulator AdeR